jgi:hypothetical protein
LARVNCQAYDRKTGAGGSGLMSLPVDITGEFTGNPQVAMIELHAPSLHATFSPASLPEHSAVDGRGSF